MRTTLNLDDKALEEAMAVSEGRTRTQVINQALAEYARRKRLKQLLALKGKAPWQGNLDALRGRR
ncbi:MAG: type II toxin-antitoxin system VapB family antitoxin [Deltaproteobacteria bacterium]|nr:type II toxin-antitoxin system VapB family antitoxin [Deltaproteobacteria bacterium]